MLSKILYKLGVIVIALFILFLSVTRAGLELIAQDGGVEQLKKNEISVAVIDKEGEETRSTYKLPEAGMLPDNILYGFKRIRDYFWLAFSTGTHKASLSILMADKKIVEFSELVNKDKLDTAIEAGNEAVDKLEYADSLVSKFEQTDSGIKQLRQQIFLAGFAYKEVVKEAEPKFSIETEKYSKLKSRLDERNQIQEKNRYSWDF